jgi:anti-sigma factor ChrR (cupin superfamily)
MTVKRTLALAATFVLAFTTAAAAQDAAKAPAAANPAPKPMSKTPIVKPAADMKWTDLDPKAGPGVKIADISGDHTKGAFSAFIKFPAGFAAPLHTHTNAMKMVVISGTIVQQPEGAAEFRLGPGSYLFQPGGEYKHTTACDKASDCLIFSEGIGAFDIKPVAAAAPAKK